MDSRDIIAFVGDYSKVLLYNFLPYLVMCQMFKLKVSKKRAYVLAFVCSGFTSVAEAASMFHSRDQVIQDMKSMGFFIQFNSILKIIVAGLFIIYVIEKAWYKYHVYYMLLTSIFLFPKKLYFTILILNNGQYKEFRVFSLVFLILASVALSNLLVRIGKKLYGKGSFSYMPKWSYFLLYAFFSIIALIGDRFYIYSIKQTSKFNVMAVITIILFVTLFVVVNQSDKKLLRFDNYLLKQQNELQYAGYIAMQHQEEEIHKLYHDIGNHINTIQVLVENGDKAEAEKYMEELEEMYQKISRDYYYDNNITSSVISQKRSYCEARSIPFTAEVQTPDTMPFEEADLMSIYSELIDAAIEGCPINTDEKKYVSIKTNIERDSFIIKVKSSKSRNEDDFRKRKRSLFQREDENVYESHLYVIDKILERIRGQREISFHKEEFEGVIKLPMEAEEPDKQTGRIGNDSGSINQVF